MFVTLSQYFIKLEDLHFYWDTHHSEPEHRLGLGVTGVIVISYYFTF